MKQASRENHLYIFIIFLGGLKTSRKHHPEASAGSRDSGPAAPPNGDAQAENPPDPNDSDDDLDSTSSSTSNSDSNAGLAQSDNE